MAEEPKISPSGVSYQLVKWLGPLGELGSGRSKKGVFGDSDSPEVVTIRHERVAFSGDLRNSDRCIYFYVLVR